MRIRHPARWAADVYVDSQTHRSLGTVSQRGGLYTSWLKHTSLMGRSSLINHRDGKAWRHSKARILRQGFERAVRSKQMFDAICGGVEQFDVHLSGTLGSSCIK